MTARAAFLARKWHKWIALLAGVQGLAWMLSGAYMVVVDLDFIHGDPLVRNLVEPLPVNPPPDLYSIASLLQDVPDAVQVEMVSQLGSPRYIVRRPASAMLIDARSGAVLSPIGRGAATELATHYYAGSAAVKQVRLLDDDGEQPIELQGRAMPLWQVTFDDRINTTFYIEPSSGELVVRRHTFWRIFDFLWMLHIMDYDERADVNNNLLRIAALAGLVLALSGFWLLWYALRAGSSASTGRNATSG